MNKIKFGKGTKFIEVYYTWLEVHSKKGFIEAQNLIDENKWWFNKICEVKPEAKQQFKRLGYKI